MLIIVVVTFDVAVVSTDPLHTNNNKNRILREYMNELMADNIKNVMIQQLIQLFLL